MQALKIYSTAVSPEWIDYNGHMRDGYYGLVMSLACDALMDHLGLDERYRRETGGTLFTLEQHLHFLHEVQRSDQLDVRVRVLAADRKRVHAAFDFYCARYADPVATGELMLLHVRQGEKTGSAPFPPAIQTAIATLLAVTDGLPPPGPGSRRLELRAR
ncbi:MAG: thioesterase family protein [Gammaproteobacteria bacterium]|nr:thioesterase family protein [Gammaproteobacteria bacterium]MDE2250853.1 thioesterase family protein [Gammaproteobacteria bacterium]